MVGRITARRTDSIAAAVIAALTLMCGCTSAGDVAYSDFRRVDPGGWYPATGHEFDISLNDSASQCGRTADIIIAMRHRRSCDVASIPLAVETFSCGSPSRRDTVTFAPPRPDSHTSPSLMESYDTLARAVTLPPDMTIAIEPAGRQDPATGIENIGIIITVR